MPARRIRDEIHLASLLEAGHLRSHCGQCRDRRHQAGGGQHHRQFGAAAVFEGISFAIALRQFRRLANGTPLREFVRRSKDPTSYTALAEDSAALVGLAIAAVGIALSHGLEMPALDGAASVLIGPLLAGVASLLAWQSRGLLIGEGIRPETARALRDIALAQPGVRDVGRVLSMYVGPDDALVTMDLDFDTGTQTSDAALAMAEVERRVRERFPMIKRLFIESGSAAAPQRWSKPNAIRSPPAAMATGPGSSAAWPHPSPGAQTATTAPRGISGNRVRRPSGKAQAP